MMWKRIALSRKRVAKVFRIFYAGFFFVFTCGNNKTLEKGALFYTVLT